MTTSESTFLEMIKPTIVDKCNKERICPSVIAMLAIIKSSWGTSRESAFARNLFNLPIDDKWFGKCYSKQSEKVYNKKSRWLLFIGFLLLAAFSAMPTWWGILLQISAIVCGMIVGDRLHKNIPDLLASCTVMGIVTGLLLMQPEYFRFGQLGNLTFLHLAALLITGLFGITTIVAKYTNARSKIHQSAYIKLKWLCRIMALLALILFVLTESVPIFVGLMGVCALSEMLTIYHGKNIPEHIYKQSFAMFLISFGIIIICPFITMLGIIYMADITPKFNIKDFTNLL